MYDCTPIIHTSIVNKLTLTDFSQKMIVYGQTDSSYSQLKREENIIISKVLYLGYTTLGKIMHGIDPQSHLLILLLP